MYAKIDRPAGLVSFVAPRGGDAVLNDWSSDVGKLMGLIEKSCHLIAKVSWRGHVPCGGDDWLTRGAFVVAGVRCSWAMRRRVMNSNA